MRATLTTFVIPYLSCMNVDPEWTIILYCLPPPLPINNKENKKRHYGALGASSDARYEPSGTESVPLHNNMWPKLVAPHTKWVHK